MQDHALSTPNPETIRVALTKQDEMLQRLRNLVSRLQKENLPELRRELSEQLNQIEEIEHRMWSAFFPATPLRESDAHRMTMTYVTYKEQYY